MDNETLQKTIEKVRKAQQEFAKYTQEQIDKIFSTKQRTKFCHF